jgi:hypothetical protein
LAFDDATRGHLQRFVGAARILLTEEFARQLQQDYGLDPSTGDVAGLDRLSDLDDRRLETALTLREIMEHYLAADMATGREGRRAVLDRIAREQAFTILNRLAALRMMEARGILIEAVAKGYQSQGFQLYQRVANGALGETGDAYRCFLFSIFDTFTADLPALFDRSAPQGRLFPRETALLAVLDEFDAPDLEALWAEDETIGWIYQYFNSRTDIDRARSDEKGKPKSPQNTRELAVRNQFFTPRYVVQFLTDNTLGRLWSEMRKGDTALKEECRYLVRCPNEVFLSQSETRPDLQNKAAPSQEELHRKPVYIDDRPKKAPRDLRVLDPACGSGHFLLYAFDLLERIYEEAWEDPQSPRSEVTGRTLREEFGTVDDLRRAVPKLIIEHNLHGIDIDSRAVQIAALALWLRAEKAWAMLGLKVADRPRINRSNIVTAEPMPGEEDLRREFTAGLKPRVLGQLVEMVFENMKLAGEAGSLLKIEEEIKGAIADARKQWLEGPKPEQQLLFPGTSDLPPRQQALRFDLDGVSDERFWVQAEDRILDALEHYAEQAENGYAIRRRLFAEDAARGFAFIDLCRQRYDVVLMNPPFGDTSLPSKSYVENTYGDTKGDVYKAFVECFQSRLIPAGYLGIISSRTGFFLGQSEDWRTRVVLRLFRPVALADLGSGVLDAMVEVAAYVLRSLSVQEARDLTHSLVSVLEKVVRDRQDRFSLPKWQAARDGLKRHQAVAELEYLEAHGFIQRSSGNIVRYTPLWHAVKKVTAPPMPIFPPLVCVRALMEEDKGTVLTDAIQGASKASTFVCDPGGFTRLPSTTFAYWVDAKILSLFKSLPSFQSEDREAVFGGSTKDDFRYLRLSWEVSCESVARSRQETTDGRIWVSYAKGGTFAHYYSDLHLAILWANDGREIKASISEYRGSRGWGYQWTAALNGHSHYFRCGLTWPRRTNGLSFRVLPSGCIFGDKGPAVFVQGDDNERLLAINAIVSSRAFSGFVALQLARVELAQSFEVGLIQRTPFPSLPGQIEQHLAESARRAWIGNREKDTSISTSHAFLLPALLAVPGKTLDERAAAWTARVRMSEESVAAIQAEIDGLAFRLYGLDASDRTALTATIATEAGSSNDAEPCEDDEAKNDAEPGEDNEAEAILAPDTRHLAVDLLDYALGAAFGRWDVRFALDETLKPKQPKPFDPLPTCPPGMLVGPDGFPARLGHIVSEEWLRTRPDAGALPPEGSVKNPIVGDNRYPVQVSWDGILVDDPGHPLDLLACIQQVLQAVWRDRWDTIEHEACQVLGVRTIREFFRKPASFFASHLQRYSKSRRKAPIYWPLSAPSRSYTLWLYYPALTDQTLYTAANDFVGPKLEETTRLVAALRTRLNRRREEESQLEQLQNLEAELNELQAELLRLAPSWKPNHDDGVQITAAPLWRLCRHRPWQTLLKETWEKLERGEYDWAHLAMTYWPDRVRDKCRADKSLAIAHDLEGLYESLPKKSGAGKRSRERGAEVS